MYHSINFVREGQYYDFKEYAPPLDQSPTYNPDRYIYPNRVFYRQAFHKGDVFLFKMKAHSRDGKLVAPASNQFRFFVTCYQTKDYDPNRQGVLCQSATHSTAECEDDILTVSVTVTEDSPIDYPWMSIGVTFDHGIQERIYNYIDYISIHQVYGVFVKNTWEDFHLISKERPLFDPPEQKTEYVDIPGASLSLDFSTALTGYPVYKNRDGDFEFVFDPYDETSEVMYPNLMSFLHGQKICAWTEDDPSRIYRGTFSVKRWDTSDTLSKPSISYNTEPYAIVADSRIFPWSANIPEVKKEEYTKVTHIQALWPEAEDIIVGIEKPVIPEVIVQAFNDTDKVDIMINGVVHRNLTRKTYVFDDILLHPGMNTVRYEWPNPTPTGSEYVNVILNYEKGVL